VAIAIALCYGLAMTAAVGRRRLRNPWVFGAFVAGAIAFPVTVSLVNSIQLLFATLFGWDMDAYSSSLWIGLLGALIAAAVNEIIKLAAALLALSREGGEPDAAAFGAAAGAGFGAVGAYQVLGFALMARTLTIGTGAPGSFATPLLQQFGFVAASAASTVLAAYGATHARIGTYLLAAILYQTLYGVLGLLFALQFYPLVVWTLLGVALGMALLAYAVVLSLRPPAIPSTPS